ncbi:MAG: GNAT family N-acetyltransferase [Pleurocapsa sp. SU_196_0]|nr:GNAT family N-acetyltransferase [Pleurocapsa sp. SU_196_0]
MGSISIRELQESDYANWSQLWMGYNAFYGRSGANTLSAVISETTWKRFFDTTEPVHALVADLDGHSLLAHYLFHRSTSDPTTCYLQDLYTAEQSRGLGVGRELILAVCHRATAAGSSRVYWQTHETNSAAIDLYNKVAERSGFIVYRKML